MKYFVYVRDSFDKLWTVVIDGSPTVNLSDAFEYATYKTFGGMSIGVKEVFTPSYEMNSNYKHGDVIQGFI